jgi:4-hydroxythreonine-4-phosphate dehydrogenase
VSGSGARGQGPGARAPLAITVGEPAGIGPDLLVALAQDLNRPPLVALGDPEVLAARAVLLGLPFRALPEAAAPERPGDLPMHAIPVAAAVAPGRLDPANARHVLALLDAAIDGCLAGRYAAMVTAPVHKGVINDAGIPFTGHTEYLADKTGTPRVVMMLVGDSLRVALATTHLPLRAVADAITRESLTDTLRILHRDLRDRFRLATPRIAVCGLNPHAGEGGHLGREEIEVIAPALDALRAEGFHLAGPHAADTLFNHLDGVDAVLAMYHDQGLPVLKYASFGAGVNVTLGLPIVRTSVDHGTALELAGTGRAEAGSLMAAIRLARELGAGHVPH